MSKKLNSKTLVFILGTFLFLTLGIITFILGINNIENYNRPYLFLLLFGVLGLLPAQFVVEKLKPSISNLNKKIDNYFVPRAYISIGFVGISLCLFSYINNGNSHTDDCQGYTLVQKKHKPGGYRNVERNILYVEIEGEIRKLSCSRKYWISVRENERIAICFQKGTLGFNYISITGD